MRKLLYFTILLVFITSCNSKKATITNNKKLSKNTVRIANDSLEYEIIITDIGFDTFLASVAKPRSFYTKNYYETKNRFYVTEWNIRVSNPLKYNSSIYQNTIDYDFSIDYGLDVNYKLYNYFKFIEYKYRQYF